MRRAEAKEDADDLPALLAQQRRRDGAINSAAHGYDDFLRGRTHGSMQRDLTAKTPRREEILNSEF